MTLITTHSGSRLALDANDLDALLDNDYHLDDIATSLAKQCRFNGHCDGFYSVAEHAILVSRLVPSYLALPALLHDAAEAYLGDLITPLKRQCPNYERLENILQAAIHHQHCQQPDQAAQDRIAQADRLALSIEFACLFAYPLPDELRPALDAFPAGIPTHLRPRRLDWHDARLAFIRRYNEVAPMPGPEAA